MPTAALLAIIATLASQSPAPALPPESPPRAPCRIFGAFVDGDLAPVAGVVVGVRGWPASAGHAQPLGITRGWQDPALVTTGDDGRFSLSFVPPTAYQFALTATAPGYGRVVRSWSELTPGQEVDLGTVLCQPRDVLIGYILDEDGDLQAEGWSVGATLDGRTGSSSGVSARSASMGLGVDPVTGQFRIEELPPGSVTLHATKGPQRIGPVTVTTKLGEDTFVELRYSGPDPRRQLVVTLDTRPFHAFQPDPGTVHAVAQDGTRYALTAEPGRGNEWRVADVAPGTYRVEVRDARFADLTHEAVRTGESTRASLVGSATLHIEVIDGETGASVEDFGVVIGYRNVSTGRSAFRIRERSTPQPVGGIYTGIVPGDVTVLVDAAGWPAYVEIDALAPGETRVVKVPVSHTFSSTRPRVVSRPPAEARPAAETRQSAVALRGRVVDTRGQPLAGVAVQVTGGEYPGHDLAGWRSGTTSGTIDGEFVMIPSRYRDDATTSADDGTFTFEGLSAGGHAVLAQRGPWNDVWTTVELPRTEPVVLTLPDATLTAIRLSLPAGESRETLHLRLGRAAGELRDPVRASRTMDGMQQLWTSGTDGLYPARHLPLGTQTLEVVRGRHDRSSSNYQPILRCEVLVAVPGPLELCLDLREVFPVQARLRTPMPDPAPAAHWSLDVQLTPTNELSATVPKSSTPFGMDRGVAIRSLVPGVYAVEVTGPGIRWSRPEPVNVVRGAPNDFEVAVPLVAREVRLLGPDGAPLAHTSVVYWTDPGRRGVDTTSADGALVLVLLEGTLSLAPLPVQVPRREHPQRTRAPGAAPRVDPGLLRSVEASATAPFGPGEGPLELRLRAD